MFQIIHFCILKRLNAYEKIVNFDWINLAVVEMKNDWKQIVCSHFFTIYFYIFFMPFNFSRCSLSPGDINRSENLYFSRSMKKSIQFSNDLIYQNLKVNYSVDWYCGSEWKRLIYSWTTNKCFLGTKKFNDASVVLNSLEFSIHACFVKIGLNANI